MPRPSLEQYGEVAWERIQQAIDHYKQVRLPKYESNWRIYTEDSSALFGSEVLGWGEIGGVAFALPELAGTPPLYIGRLNLATIAITIKNGAMLTREPTISVDILEPEKDTPELRVLTRELLHNLWKMTNAQKAFQMADRYKRIFGFALIEVGEKVIMNRNGEIIDSRITVTPIPATRVLYDLTASAPSLDACRWMAKVVFMDKDQLESMAKIAGWRDVDKVAKADFKPFVEKIGGAWQEYVFEKHKREEEELYPIFFYHDAQNRESMILAAGSDDKPFVVLKYFRDAYPYVDYYPFVLLTGTEVPETFHPLSDIDLMAPHLELLTRLVTIYAHHAARSIPKFAYIEGAITERGRRALSSASIGAGVELTPNAPPDAIKPLVTEPPNKALVEMIALAERYFNEAAGLTHYHRADIPPRVKSATEAQHLVMLSGVRGQMELQLLENAMGELAEKMYGLFLTRQYTIPIVIRMPTGERQLAVVSPEMLPHALRVSVNVGSTAFMDYVQDRQDMITLLQVIANIMQVGGGTILLPIIEHLLATFPQLNASDVTYILQSIARIQAQQQQVQQLAALMEAQKKAEKQTKEEKAAEEEAEEEVEEEEGEEEGEE